MERRGDDEQQDFHILKPKSGHNWSTHGWKAKIMYEMHFAKIE
jgi:hypothetical protein